MLHGLRVCHAQAVLLCSGGGKGHMSKVTTHANQRSVAAIVWWHHCMRVNAQHHLAALQSLRIHSPPAHFLPHTLCRPALPCCPLAHLRHQGGQRSCGAVPLVHQQLEEGGVQPKLQAVQVHINGALRRWEGWGGRWYAVDCGQEARFMRQSRPCATDSC